MHLFSPISTELAITLAALLAGLALVAWAVWLEKRPRSSLTPSLMPTIPIMGVGAVLTLVTLVHTINLLGFHTGR